MLGADQRVSVRDVKFIVVNIMQEHIDAAEVVGRDIDLLPIKSLPDVAGAENFRRLQKQRTGTAGGVYVPTDFDTIEKAFSGVKTAEKGIKQGLSRSITDSESPFSLYSVVDFCRSKVRRHRGV